MQEQLWCGIRELATIHLTTTANSCTSLFENDSHARTASSRRKLARCVILRGKGGWQWVLSVGRFGLSVLLLHSIDGGRGSQSAMWTGQWISQSVNLVNHNVFYDLILLLLPSKRDLFVRFSIFSPFSGCGGRKTHLSCMNWRGARLSYVGEFLDRYLRISAFGVWKWL